ncbi:hypothetical protein QBC99_001475 [Beijerinckia sp. GAS462]|nr:hypothetical protein [Beijerinckia sp. GAS462]SEC00486.1 hypothetical protein SAMN05443249_1684 [Beijerinckia sp. 28-YEA-48]
MTMLRLKALASAVAVLAIVAIVCAYLFFFPYPGSNAGFGPEWTCIPQIKGGPICTKRVGG